MEEITHRPLRQPLAPPGGIDHHVRDMTATVSADVTLGQLQAKLAAQGQWLPIDGDTDRSLGTLISTDSTGPLRLGYGAWRDLLLGVQFTNGRGELITAGGRTVKNVAGYDLTKFMVGQRGIFANLLTLTTRTYRQPAAAILVRHPPDVQILHRLIPTSLRPSWAILVRDALLFGYLADDKTLAFYRSALSASEPLEIRDQSRDDDIACRRSLWEIDGARVFRVSVPPARLGEFTSRLTESRWAADAAFGIVCGVVSSDETLAAVREGAANVGGACRFFRGLFGTAIDLSTNPAERQIIERLKRAFDPDAKLDPLPWGLS